MPQNTPPPYRGGVLRHNFAALFQNRKIGVLRQFCGSFAALFLVLCFCCKLLNCSFIWFNLIFSKLRKTFDGSFAALVHVHFFCRKSHFGVLRHFFSRLRLPQNSLNRVAGYAIFCRHGRVKPAPVLRPRCVFCDDLRLVNP